MKPRRLPTPWMPLAACLCLLFFAGLVHAADAPMNALLITGQSNHNWQLSSPILKTIIEDAGLFQVDTATSPPEGSDMSAFAPDFAAYDVVVLDYTGDSWPESVQQSFVAYVAGGGGVVVVHAANNAFPDWPEYNEITGLGGWGNRNERHGPYVRWRDGALSYDMTPGPGGAHGRQHEFVVRHRDLEHPITRGLPEAWLHAQDELYHHLRGPAKNMTVLATAYSDVETGGTGEHEPILFTVSYGKGRMFQTALGHAGSDDPPPALQCVGFIVTLQRGVEWAATGAVMQPIPEDFPTESEVRMRPRFKQDVVASLMKELESYVYNDSLSVLTDLEALARERARRNASMEDLESAYLALLQSGKASCEAALFACKQLSAIGGRASIPVLSAMLLEPNRSHMARFALERIPDSRALEALRRALPLVAPEERAGIIGSLGARRDRQSLPLLGSHVHDRDPRVAAAAVQALANIGTSDAADMLLAAANLLEGDLRHLAQDAYVRCGFEMLRARKPRDARAVFDKAHAEFADAPQVRAAALRGRIAAAGPNSAEAIMDALRDSDVAMQTVAAASVRDISDKRVLSAVAAESVNLPPRPRAVLIAALSETKASDITPLLIEAAQSEEAEVRMAALEALGRVGDGGATLFLIQRAMVSSGEEAQVARQSLARLRGADAVILEALSSGDPALRPELLKAVTARRIADAAPLLLEQLVEARDEERALLLAALTEVAGPEHLDMILPMLLNAGAQGAESQIADVVAAAAERADSGEERVASLKEALATEANPLARRNLYMALGKIADESALPLVVAGLEEGDASLRLAAIEALGAWPTDAPLEALRDAMTRFQDAPEGSAALSGYIRLAALKVDRDPAETVALYEAALALARRPEDKQACIAAMGKTGAAPALPVLYDALCGDDAASAAAAVRALGAWPDATPMARLEILAKDGPEALRPEALRGYFRLVGINQELSEEEALNRYREALTLAPNLAEQKRIMSGLASAETLGALMIVTEHLDNPALKSEAEVAAVKIAANVAGRNPAGVRQILEKIEASADSDYIREEIKQAYALLDRFEDYVTAWEAAGPYVREGAGRGELFKIAFAPENEAERDGVEWRTIPLGTHGDMPFLVELDKALGGDNRAAYLRSHVWSDAELDAMLEVGSDDGIKVWLNGDLVHANDAARPAVPGQDKAPVHLRQGWNDLLVKVTQGSGEWSACARFRTREGEAIAGLRSSIRPQ